MTNAYSFVDVSASLTGPTGVANLGYGSNATEEGITVDMAGDKNTMTIGADGGGMHSLHADKSGVITVRLLQTSPVNAILQAMYDAQQLSSTLWGQNTIVVRQMSSGDVTMAKRCAFKKKANLPYAKVGRMLEWAFDCIHIDSVLGVY